MESTIATEVLIAGGGPCGLMLANELGRFGVRCLLVEPKPGTAFNPQANATQARTMEHFRRHGFAHEVRAQGLPPDHPTDIAYFTRFTGHELARLRLPTGRQALESVRTMRGSWSAAELPHRVAQKFVEETLLRHARRYAANTLLHGWRLEQFTDTREGIDALIAPVGGGEPRRVAAQFLFGADGARSGTRQQLGIRWQGETGTRREFMGGRMFAVYCRVPAFYELLSHDRAWMYVCVNPERRAFMASVDGKGEFAFHAAVHEGEDADAWTADDAKRILAQAMGRDVPIEVLAMQTWTAGHALVAERFQQGRVLLGGDAVHLFTPTGGLGYNTAIEDAVNLGWKLAHVVQGRAPLVLLESYELERKPLAHRNTAYAKRFADSVGLFPATSQLELDTAEGEAARRNASDYLNAHARLEFNIPGVTFGGRYDGSPIIVADGTVPPIDTPNAYVPTACPGGRPPHAWLSDGRSLFDSFHAGWTLLSLGANAPHAHEFEAAAAQLRLDLQVVRHEDDSLAQVYEAPLVLVRPDQVVAWRGRDAASATSILRAVSNQS